MITIITGTPGAGKTALAVSMLLEVKDRPIYVDGVPELQIPHEVADGTKWHELPDGALILIDEAQRVFRPRSQGSSVPEHVAQLETHRHRGIDIWLVTQHPTLLDSNVRKLCGKHVHIRSMWMGRKLYEWSEVADPSSRSERETSASRGYKLDKKVFGLYKSASIHVKQSRRIPWYAYVLGIAILAVPALGYRLFESLIGRFEPVNEQAGVTSTERPQAAGAGAPAATSARPSEPVGVDYDAYTPRLPARPETAPLYDSIRQVKSMPVVKGCIASPTRCVCITGQGTDAGLSDGQCRDWIANPPFDPWSEPMQPQPVTVAQAPTTQVGGDHQPETFVPR